MFEEAAETASLLKNREQLIDYNSLCTYSTRTGGSCGTYIHRVISTHRSNQLEQQQQAAKSQKLTAHKLHFMAHAVSQQPGRE